MTRKLVGMSGSYDPASLKAMRALGVDTVRVDMWNGALPWGSAVKPAADAIRAAGMRVWPLVNTYRYRLDEMQEHAAAVGNAVQYADDDRGELLNEIYGDWYEHRNNPGSMRPTGYAIDIDGQVRLWRFCADALVASAAAQCHPGVKLTISTRHAPYKRADGTWSDPATGGGHLLDQAAAYQRIFGSDIASHPAFGGWAVHPYGTGRDGWDMVARIAAVRPGDEIHATEGGWNSQMGATDAAQESAWATRAYADLKASKPPELASVFYWNQDRANGCGTTVSAAIKKAVTT